MADTAQRIGHCMDSARTRIPKCDSCKVADHQEFISSFMLNISVYRFAFGET